MLKHYYKTEWNSHRFTYYTFPLILFLLAILGLVSGCRPTVGLTIAGSTSVQPFAEILAEKYMQLNKVDVVNVQGGGSSAGIKSVETGTADIGMSSRELTPDEQGLTVIPIAIDGIALIVHPSNPIQNLTLQQISDIYSGKIKKWNEVGGPSWQIHLVTREEGSGTRSAFTDMVMKKVQIDPTAIVQDSNGAVRQVVTGDKAAIGYISLGLVNSEVKAIAIDNVLPSKETILNHDYTLWRRFLFLIKGQENAAEKQFIDFTLSPDGQEILAREGLVPISSVTAGTVLR
ncbi:MAG TPA: phosphate ABC transporter substrate-binding protein [Dehalococcoidales bacterium]|nr:phosphate ABC transporter substrate-binding protein [Dehalococcoidales bacterium]